MNTTLTWDELATAMGFRNEKHMFEYFYHAENMTIAMIAQKLETGTATIGRRMSACGIKLRRRGGANNNARKKLMLHYMDQRWVFGMSTKALSKYANINPTTIWSYQKGVQRLYEVCSDFANWGIGEVRTPESPALGTPTGDEPGLQGLLPFEK